MKFRNSWKSATKQWDKISIRFRLSSIDVFTLEIDISREFYMLTISGLPINPTQPPLITLIICFKSRMRN